MPAETSPTSEPTRLTLSEAADAVHAGRLTVDDLRSACLSRIDARDADLRAWAAVDTRRTTPHPGPLAGVPVGVKDIIDVADMPTRAGSSLHEVVPERDAPAAARLRRAGALVLGKTQCTEFATNDPAPTRNPWDARRTPGGSSPGSAVAVATGMCFASLDTQTAGDILRPAAYNGIVGFKPTYGTVSRRGVVGVAWSIDTLGVQARAVRDAAVLFDALTGARHPAATAAEHGLQARPPTLGVLRDDLYAGRDTEMSQEPDRVAALLTGQGADVGELSSPEPLELAHAAHRVITFAECACLHEDRYATSAAHLGPKFRTLIELGLVTSATSYLRAQRVRTRFVRCLREQLRQVDALLVPAVSDVAPLDTTTTGDSAFQIPWTLCGFPALSLPTGLSADGMPLAVQLVGQPFGDTRLLRAAAWCEAVLGAQPTPPPP